MNAPQASLSDCKYCLRHGEVISRFLNEKGPHISAALFHLRGSGAFHMGVPMREEGEPGEDKANSLALSRGERRELWEWLAQGR